MDEEKINLEKTDQKFIYSLSFIVVLYLLKDFIVSWFPENFSIIIFGLILTINDMINYMILLLFLSLYLHGISYLISNPLNKFRRGINLVASFFWMVFIIFPFFIITILIINKIFSNWEFALSFISLIFALISGILSYWVQKKSKENYLLLLDNQIEELKSKVYEGNKIGEFIRDYIILESLVKKILIEKLNLTINLETIHFSNTIIFLSNKKYISEEMRKRLHYIWDLRNKVVHQNYKISKKDAQKAKKAITDLQKQISEVKSESEKAREFTWW